MQQPFIAENHLDADGKPAGGYAEGVGIRVEWQNGPLGRDEERTEPNGAFVETLIAIVIQRIEHYNSTGFACRENSLAITKLEEAQHWLQHRTADRERRAVEGTHQR